ncbi:MAG: hypothetical protein PHR98_03080 [Candidatus Shapirobacteria bacterium]|jgi:hypothetical protein|nr:hypothetical protein [Candidatus Shapirobacteria bacterium]
MNKHKQKLAEEKVYEGRMVSDFCLYTAQEVYNQKLREQEFVDPDIKWSLKFVDPYDRQGRTDKITQGAAKPRVHVNAFFRKKLSLSDHRELYGVNADLIVAEHRYHERDSEWHNLWKERVKNFCEIEKRIYPDGNPKKEGYKVADAFYTETNTVIEFQKAFDDKALEKSAFYKNENKRLMWVFYLPTLEVFKDDGKYKIREDNFFHFFRIDSLLPYFFKENLVFLQDKKDRIYYVEQLERAETQNELQASIRCFKCKKTFINPAEFVEWLRNDWPKSDFFIQFGVNDNLKSLDELLLPHKESSDKMFFLQNGTKNDVNGISLIYCFVKDGNAFRFEKSSFVSYRCFKDKKGYYHPNSAWEKTIHNPRDKKWILLATNSKKYSEEIVIDKK